MFGMLVPVLSTVTSIPAHLVFGAAYYGGSTPPCTLLLNWPFCELRLIGKEAVTRKGIRLPIQQQARSFDQIRKNGPKTIST